ncbi:hypothetical protein HDK77DRAFT_55078 [Phyllosticta capitalensis]|uniref:uncharacterized protein n=1 Tax=Phyllosticta capitalensis TaxID=121624 RepID=UPI00312DE148
MDSWVGRLLPLISLLFVARLARQGLLVHTPKDPLGDFCCPFVLCRCALLFARFSLLLSSWLLLIGGWDWMGWGKSPGERTTGRDYRIGLGGYSGSE